jgi:hypothetical protein
VRLKGYNSRHEPLGLRYIAQSVSYGFMPQMETVKVSQNHSVGSFGKKRVYIPDYLHCAKIFQTEQIRKNFSEI